MKNQLEDLLYIISSYFKMDSELIKSSSRKKEIVKIRHIYCYLAFNYSEFKTKEIGDLINRNHSSVSQSVKKINNLMVVYKKLNMDISNLKNKILNEQKLYIEKNEYPPIVISNVNLLKLAENYTNSFLCLK